VLVVVIIGGLSVGLVALRAPRAVAKPTVEVTGTHAWVDERGRVATACFAFDLPPGWVLLDESAQCRAYIRPADGDVLSTMGVTIFPVDSSANLQAMAKNAGWSLTEMGSRTIAGREWSVLTGVDNYGLTLSRLAIFDLPANYVFDGARWRGAQLTSYGSPEAQVERLAAVAESLEFIVGS
jgi:hypothetical protein